MFTSHDVTGEAEEGAIREQNYVTGQKSVMVEDNDIILDTKEDNDIITHEKYVKAAGMALISSYRACIAFLSSVLF